MTMKILNDANEEIEVYTVEEHNTAVAAAATAKENEFKPLLETTQKERDEAKAALSARTGEFAQFRKLSDEQVKQLTEKDRIIYENGLALQAEREKREAQEKKTKDAEIDTAIRSKIGGDDKLFAKTKELWATFNIETDTREQMDQKVLMILGAIGTTQPDLVAAIPGFTAGAYAPPAPKKAEDGQSFADTEKGKQAANELGLMMEPPKKDK